MPSPKRVTIAKRVWVSAVLALAVASIVWNRTQTAPSNAACVAAGRNFVQQATHLQLYLRPHAVFERASVKQLPYVVSSHRFAALPAAPEVAATIQGVVGGAVDDWLTR